MRLSKLLLVLLFGFLAACSDQLDLEEEIIQEVELLSQSEIDDYIENSLQETGEFNWESASDQMIWSAAVHSGGLVTVGYQPEAESNVNKRMADVDITSTDWVQARSEIIGVTVSILERVKGVSTEIEDLKVDANDVLPYFDMEVTDFQVFKELLEMPGVRYIEPISYEPNFVRININRKELSDSGCGSNDADNGIPSSDYTLISPNAKMSWNYTYSNISSAWTLSTGRGITVGLIDTGTSSAQSRLGSSFNSGSSLGRTIERLGAYRGDGFNDQCGHGTSMAGVIASPRTNNGVPVGVAYNCNLVSIRGTSDVVVNSSSEKTGVANSLIYLGNRSDVKIISMSIGNVFSSSKVKDAVRYAYGRGKLIFAAAGTSTSFTNWYGVIFPANMSETVAVTGIKEQSTFRRCDVCHSGRKVDFSLIMERAGTENHPLTLAQSGDIPSTVGGSSVATATAAGIAALVWARHPNWSRSQVLNRLIQTSSQYPNKSSSYGWGVMDAYAAVQ
ncbi:MAG: S8 family serine peptidase [Bacteroidota bacterium]